MNPLRTLSAKTLAVGLAVLCASATAASAAVVLRTAPFPSLRLTSGTARCMARNAGAGTANVNIKLFDNTGTVLTAETTELSPNDADEGEPASIAGSNPTWCECSVPSAATFACSFVYINGPINVVVPAK